MLKISVIIPVYNVKKDFLNKCLESVFNQKYKYFESIVVDDGSTIDYNDILKKFNDIRYYKIDNHGVSYARNIGIKNSTGDYIMFLDADDYLTPNALSYFADRAEKFDDQIILSRNYNDDNKLIVNKYNLKSSKYIDKKEDLYRAILLSNDEIFSCVDTAWAKLYKKEFLNKNNILFNEKLRFFEDVLFNYECYFKANSIYYLNKVTYGYRINNMSVCHSFQNNLFNVSLEYIHELNNFFKNNNIHDENFSVNIFRTIVRLFRKYFIYINDISRLENEINIIFNDKLIQDKLSIIDEETLDVYKINLLNLLKQKDMVQSKIFINDICKKGLLKR